MDKSRWEYKKLGEVATIINGKNQKTVEDESGIYPICGSGGIMGYANDFLCPEQTIIIGRKGNINRPIYMEQKFWNVDTAFGIVADKSQLVPKYLYYFCVDFNFERLNKAVTIPSLVKSDLLKIKMYIPPLSEQQHIVEELDLLSSIIEKKKAQLNELDNLAQSLFYEMFGDPITNGKGWEVKKLSELSDIKGRVGWKGYKKTDLRNHGPYVLGATHLGEDGNVNLENPVYISREKYEESPEIYVNKGDVILAQRGSIGKVALVRKEIGEATINPCVLIVRPKKIQSDYLVFFFMNNQVQKYLIKINTGGVQPMITQKQVKYIDVPVPSHSLQQQFASKIEAIEHQKELIKQSIKEVETLFNSRMDYYFN